MTNQLDITALIAKLGKAREICGRSVPVETEERSYEDDSDPVPEIVALFIPSTKDKIILIKNNWEKLTVTVGKKIVPFGIYDIILNDKRGILL